MAKLITIAAIATVTGFMTLSAQAQVNLTAETGPPGSAPHTAIISLGELASKLKIANFQVAEDQTLTNSVQNVAEGKTDVAAAPLILPFLLSRGAGPYAKIGKKKGAELTKNISVLYTYRYGGYGLYAFNSASVKGWGDLKGKKIINGPPRGAALANARAMVKLVTGLSDGKDYKGVQSNWGQMVKTITDGSGDAMVLPITFPDARVTRALASGEITMWSVPMKAWNTPGMQRYLKSPGTVPFVIDMKKVKPVKGFTIVTEDGTWRSPATAGAEVVPTKMDFKVAKALTQAMLKNIPHYIAKNSIMAVSGLGEIDPAITGMCGAVPIKYHPGAVAAWEEAGFKVPACAKP